VVRVQRVLLQQVLFGWHPSINAFTSLRCSLILFAQSKQTTFRVSQLQGHGSKNKHTCTSNSSAKKQANYEHFVLAA